MGIIDFDVIETVLCYTLWKKASATSVLNILNCQHALQDKTNV